MRAREEGRRWSVRRRYDAAKSTFSTTRLVALLATALTLASAPAAAAAARCPRTTLGDVEDEVMCTVCGVPLNLATDAPQAARERAFIVALIRQCRTKSQIKQALVDQYGERVLALPKAKGFGLGAYVVPVVGFLIAAALVGAAAVRWRRRRPDRRASQPAAESPIEPGASARLEADLQRYDL
ncbi:MAG: cytochrome c-type biogenesis protein CcmH [Actinobacteria bacterium]|nr:cytochrome c-type biogenesis protein CcmH [Actinomycetota bacterium]